MRIVHKGPRLNAAQSDRIESDRIGSTWALRKALERAAIVNLKSGEIFPTLRHRTGTVRVSLCFI